MLLLLSLLLLRSMLLLLRCCLHIVFLDPQLAQVYSEPKCLKPVCIRRKLGLDEAIVVATAEYGVAQEQDPLAGTGDDSVLYWATDQKETETVEAAFAAQATPAYSCSSS